MKHLLTLTFLSIFGLTHAQVPSYVPTNGLVGWWPFNGNANDESGNGNNGTVNGATLTADRFGVTNKAFSFDGDDYINGFVNNSGLSNLSFSVWVNTPNTSSGTFVHLGSDNGSPYCNGVSLGNFSAPSTNLVGHYSCIGFFNSSANFATNQWSHCTMVLQNNVLYFYINGILLSQIPTAGFYSPDDNFWFGSTYINYVSMFLGKLDDIGIWNRALTDCEIKDLYNSQLGSANTSSSITQTAIDSYTWPVNNQTYTQSGVYTDTLVNAAGCDSIITLNLELDFTGIQTSNLTSLKLYPNPVQEVLHVEGLAGKEFEFEVLSVDGKLLQKGKSQGEISVKELRKGNYVLRVGQQQVSFVKM